MYLGFDALAIGPLTRQSHLYGGGRHRKCCGPHSAPARERGRMVERRIQTERLSRRLVGKGNYRHFMERRITSRPSGRRHAGQHDRWPTAR